MAGRVGFEPTAEEPQHSLSRRAQSASLAPPQYHVVNQKPSGFQAEGEGFEPTVGFPTPVFKTGALSHSAILPETSILS